MLSYNDLHVQLPPEIIEAICELAAVVHDVSTSVVLARVCKRLQVRIECILYHTVHLKTLGNVVSFHRCIVARGAPFFKDHVRRLLLPNTLHPDYLPDLQHSMALENIINSCTDMEHLCCTDTVLFSSEDSAHQSGSRLSSLHIQALSPSRFLSGTALNHLPLTHLVISLKVSYIIASVLSAHSARIFENVLACSTLTHIAFFIHWDCAFSTDALLEGIRFADLVEKCGCFVLVHDMGRKRANARNQMALARLTKGTNAMTFLLTENPSSDHLFPPINPNKQGVYFDPREHGGFWEQVDSKMTSPVPCDTDATF